MERPSGKHICFCLIGESKSGKTLLGAKLYWDYLEIYGAKSALSPQQEKRWVQVLGDRRWMEDPDAHARELIRFAFSAPYMHETDGRGQHYHTKEVHDIAFHLPSQPMAAYLRQQHAQHFKGEPAPPASSQVPVHHLCTLMDCPGHQDFAKNTLWALQLADVAILAIRAPEEVPNSWKDGDDDFNCFGSQARQQLLWAVAAGIKHIVVAITHIESCRVSKGSDGPGAVGLHVVQIVKRFMEKNTPALNPDRDVWFVPVDSETSFNISVDPYRDVRRYEWLRHFVRGDNQGSDPLTLMQVLQNVVEVAQAAKYEASVPPLVATAGGGSEEEGQVQTQPGSDATSAFRFCVVRTHQPYGFPGTLVTGRVVSGSVSTNGPEHLTESVKFTIGGGMQPPRDAHKKKKPRPSMKVYRIECWNRAQPRATAGDYVSLHVRWSGPEIELKRGAILERLAAGTEKNDTALSHEEASPSEDKPPPVKSAPQLSRVTPGSNALTPFVRPPLPFGADRVESFTALLQAAVASPVIIRYGTVLTVSVGLQQFACRLVSVRGLPRGERVKSADDPLMHDQEERHATTPPPPDTSAGGKKRRPNRAQLRKASEKQKTVIPKSEEKRIELLERGVHVKKSKKKHSSKAAFTLSPGDRPTVVFEPLPAEVGWSTSGWDRAIVLQLHSAGASTRPSFSSVIVRDHTKATVGVGPVTGIRRTSDDWEHEELFINLIALRRKFPFELAHYVLRYVSTHALEPFK